MNDQAWRNLESKLVAAGVPHQLWPRYFEKEKYLQLRRRAKTEDDFFRLLRNRLAKDEGEQRRRAEFAKLIILLLWMLQERNDKPENWLQLCFLTVLRSSPYVESYQAERISFGLTWAKFGRETAESVLPLGLTNMAGQPFPLPTALREAEQIDLEAAKPASEPLPAPQPDPKIASKEAERVDEKRADLANPNF